MRRAAASLDLAAVLVFVVIGRAAHHHDETASGVASTAWPFLVGLAAAWLIAGRRSPATPRRGLVLCVVTVAVGMALRVLAGQGTAAAFIGVALAFLGALMVGGRVLLSRGSSVLARRWPGLAGRRSSGDGGLLG